MSIAHQDFLAYSNSEIRSIDLSEFKIRNAASRAYYALYHKARKRLEELGIPLENTPNEGSHSALIATLCRISPKAKSISTEMNKLKRFRHTCDYDLQATVDLSRVRVHIAEVERLISMLDRVERP